MSHRQRGPSKSFEDPTTPPDTGDRGSQNDPPPPRAGNLPNSTQQQPRRHSPNSQSSTITPSPPPHPNPPPPGVLWKNVGNTIPVGFTEVPAPALAELITTKLELTALELQNLQAPRLTYNHCVKANGSYFVPTPPGWCRPFGLSWKNLGSVRPVRGSEVSSPTLASILADRLEITLDEFHSLDLHHLSFGHYVKSGDNYYGPRLHRLKSGARLRGYLADWLADQDIWEGHVAASRPMPMDLWTPTEDPPARNQWLLISSFFKDFMSGSINSWLTTQKRRMLWTCYGLGEHLLGDQSPAVSTAQEEGKVPPSPKRRWRDLEHRERHEWLSLLHSSGYFCAVSNLRNVLVWNLGPHGYESSKILLDQIWAENRSIVCLQDLRIPLSERENVRNDIESRFPYKVFISTVRSRSQLKRRHPIKEAENRHAGYLFSTLTAIHTGTFRSAETLRLGSSMARPVSRPRTGKHVKRKNNSDITAGRLLCIKATRKSGEDIHVFNVYQFTAARPKEQKAIWDLLEKWIKRHQQARILLVGDLNSTSKEGNMRVNYSKPTSNLIKADTMFDDFLKETAGTWTPPDVPTWKNGTGRAAILDHAISWNLPIPRKPEVRWANHLGSVLTGASFLKHDHAQLLVDVDTTSIPLPTLSKPQPSTPDKVDVISLTRNLATWKDAASRVVQPWNHDPEITGDKLYMLFQEDSRAMRDAALMLQRKERAALRRARERKPERSKEQTQCWKRIHLLEAALRDTATQLRHPLTPPTKAILETARLIGGAHLTEGDVMLLRFTPKWQQSIESLMQDSRHSLTKITAKQRKAAGMSARRRLRWLFDNGVKGLRKVMGKYGNQESITSALQLCPNGIRWPLAPYQQPTDMTDENGPLETHLDQLHLWFTSLGLDHVRHALCPTETSVSVTVQLLHDLLPLLNIVLQQPPPGYSGPPSLIYSEGPWQGENLIAAVETFFQSNAYDCFATCPTCKGTEKVVLPYIQAESGQESPTTSRGEPNPPDRAEMEPEMLVATQTANPGTPEHLPAQPAFCSARGQYEYAHVPPTSPPIHRRILAHFCPTCMKPADFRTKGAVKDMDFMTSKGIFDYRTIPAHETLRKTVTFKAFTRFLQRMANRKAFGIDGIPAEILKHAPHAFKLRLCLLVNEILTSRFKIPKIALIARVVLLYKKSDPQHLSNYRPIALLNSVYQLINIILADRLQSMAEKHLVFESSQFGFRWHRGVANSAQKQQWLLKAAKQGNTIIRIDLDYTNAFNAAGHSCLWSILEKFGVPDISLLQSIYESSTMRVSVDAQDTADIFMDTGTAQGSALSPLLFDLFINALLRLLNATGTPHGAPGLPGFNHLAFADDLSLYIKCTRDANELLSIVNNFEQWSGLKIALKKSFVTGILHGSGARRRATRPTCLKRKRPTSTPKDNESDTTLDDAPRETEYIVRPRKCSLCAQTKHPRHFSDPSLDTDSLIVCMDCETQWMPKDILYAGKPLPVIPGQSPSRFLGIHGNMHGDCSAQIRLVLSKSAEVLTFLHDSKLSPKQNMKVVSWILPAYLRFTAGIVPWPLPKLKALTRLWARAYRLALKLPLCSPSCLFTWPKSLGCRGKESPIHVLLQGIWAHLHRCCAYDDGTYTLARREYAEAVNEYSCFNLMELQTEMSLGECKWENTLHNTFTHACYLAVRSQVKIEWDPFNADLVRNTPASALARILSQHRTPMRIPGCRAQNPMRFQSLDRSTSILTYQNDEDLQQIHPERTANHPEQYTTHEIVALNFPGCRTTAELATTLQGLLEGVHGTDSAQPPNLDTDTPLTRENHDITASEGASKGQDKFDTTDPDSGGHSYGGMDDEADPDVFHTDTGMYGDDRPASPRGTQDRSTSPEEMVDAEDPGALYADTDIHGYDKPTSLWETNDKNTDMDDTEIPTEEWDLLETQALADAEHSSTTPAYAPGGSPNGLHTIQLPRSTPLSWSKATLGLRQERIELENRARSDTEAELNASERQRLTFLSTAEKVYSRLLPKLKAASFDSFDRIPRRRAGSNWVHYLPSIAGVSTSDLTLVSHWLQSRSFREKVVSNKAQAPTIQTIDASLSSQARPPTADDITDLQMATQKMSRLGSISTVRSFWSQYQDLPFKQALLEDDRSYWIEQISSAIDDEHWAEELLSIVLQMGLTASVPTRRARAHRPRPTSTKPDLDTPVMADPESMGLTLIQAVTSHRPHLSGTIWREIPTMSDDKPYGRELTHKGLSTLLRKSPILSLDAWKNLRIRDLAPDHFVQVQPRNNLMGPSESPKYFRPVNSHWSTELQFKCRLNTPSVERLTALVQLWKTGDKLAFKSAILHDHDLLRMPPEKWPELRDIRPKGWWVTCIGEALLKPCTSCKNLYDTQALDKDSNHCANCRTANPPSDIPFKKHRPLNYYFDPSPEDPSSTEPRSKRRRTSQHTLGKGVTRHIQNTSTPPFTPSQEELQAIRSFDLNSRYGPITGRSRDERAALATSLDISLPLHIRQLQQQIGTLDDESLGPQAPTRWTTIHSTLSGLGPLENAALGSRAAHEDANSDDTSDSTRRSQRCSRKRKATEIHPRNTPSSESKPLLKKPVRAQKSTATACGRKQRKPLQNLRPAQSRKQTAHPRLRCKQGLLFRSADASLLSEATELKADTALTLDQVAEYVIEMLHMETTAICPDPDSQTTSWNEDWLTLEDTGFPEVYDGYHRNLHPAVHTYLAKKVRAGDASLLSLLTFRRRARAEHCALCDAKTPEIQCELCQGQFHLRCFTEDTCLGPSSKICSTCLGDRRQDRTCTRPARLQRANSDLAWERYSIPHHALDPPKLPEGPDDVDILQSLAAPTMTGYVRVQSKSVPHLTSCGKWNMRTCEGITQSLNLQDPLKLSGARWYFLLALNSTKTETPNVFNPTAELETDLPSELLLQQTLDNKKSSYCFSWKVLRAAQKLGHAQLFIGSTMVAAPYFFAKAQRGDKIFWSHEPEINAETLTSTPRVITLSDLTDNEAEAALAAKCWVVLTPALPSNSRKLKTLKKQGRLIVREKGNAYRQRGWWQDGTDKLVSHSIYTECWIAKSADAPSTTAIETLRAAIKSEDPKDEPLLSQSPLDRLYNSGTESGLLNIAPRTFHIAASDGSVEANGAMWAGVFVEDKEGPLIARIGRDPEGSTSLRSELGGGYMALNDCKDLKKPVILFTDSETMLELIDAWIGEGTTKSLYNVDDSDILREILSLLHHRTQLGYPTFLIKLKAHRGDPYNELGDRAADTAASSEDTPLIWDAPSGRPLYRWKEENSPDEHTTVKFSKRLRLHLQQSILSHPLEPKPAPLGRKWTRIEPVLGLEWVPCNSNSTAHQDEIRSSSLVSALRRKTAFNKHELEKLDLPVLTTNSFIKVDGKCLHPAPPAPPPSTRLCNSLLEQELALSLCLRWHKCHGKRPDEQYEVKHEGLKTALARTRSLTKDEWRDLHVTDTIGKNSWVAAADDSSWFAPRLKTLTISPDVAKELPPHLQLRYVHVRVGHDLYQVDTKGHPFAQSFLSRPHGCQEVIGKWLSCKLTPDNHARWIQLAIANMFPSRSLLHKWGKESSPKCTHCNTVETYGHIQSRCTLLEKPRTAAHHLIWREILMHLKAAQTLDDIPDDNTPTTEESNGLDAGSPQASEAHNRNEASSEAAGEENAPTIVYCKGPDTRNPTWRFPAAISKLQHRESSLGSILVDLNFFESLDQVKTAYRHFAPTHTQSILPQVTSLLSSLDLPPESLDDKRTFDQLQTLLKLSTMKLSDTAIIPKSEEELRSMADSFADLRPDGYAINDDKRIISLMEFSRAMDTEDYWEARKDQEKKLRYAPAITFFDQLPNKKGWSIQQNNFTVGVRGSLSTHTELKEVPGFPKLRSFAQELVDLGVPQGATKRICKQVVLKTLEVHGAMIRSYYAAKFNPTTVDFSSSFKDAHLIHKILQKP